ncbi:MAG: hypothetical protein HXL64_02025 [Thermobifida sp.]|nr:hypothetical protein [Thermobifida sp.]
MGCAHVSAASKRGKSLDVDVKQLAKGKRLGVTQLRVISRDILNRAVALAQLHGERSTADVAHGGRVAVLRERIGERLGTHPGV